VSSKVFDISYLSVDSIQEGVGASQIVPLVKALASQGKNVCLTTCEKSPPPNSLKIELANVGISWNILHYGKNGAIHGFLRLGKIFVYMPRAKIIHARSDIPAVAAVLRFPFGRILWDVRSLWADQRRIIDSKGWNRATAGAAKFLERIAASRSTAMTTLTQAVVPVLERRYKKLPIIREVIPTCTQLDKFQVSKMPSGLITCLLPGTFNNFYDLDQMRQIISNLRELTQLQIVWVKPKESTTIALNVGEDLVTTAAYKDMPALFQSSHFGLIVCKSDNLEVLTAVAPTKVAEFLASGRPILVSRGIGDLDSLIETYKVGVSLEPGIDMRDSLLRFMELLKDPEIHIRCRQLAEEMFSMASAVEKYTSIYRKMAPND
jgi:glycosyltransferase involved in cell wall biosynthesis